MTSTEQGEAVTVLDLLPVLAAIYGTSSRGGLDTAALAAAHAVSRRTMQRWLRRGSTADVAKLLAPLRPDRFVVADEAAKARYAEQALVAIAHPRRRGIKRVWRTQQWLDPHVVVVVEVPRLGLGRVTFARVAGEPFRNLRSRGAIVDECVVPNRFAAVLVKHAVLTAVAEARIVLPGGVLSRGRTQTWLRRDGELELDTLRRDLELVD